MAGNLVEVLIGYTTIDGMLEIYYRRFCGKGAPALGGYFVYSLISSYRTLVYIIVIVAGQTFQMARTESSLSP